MVDFCFDWSPSMEIGISNIDAQHQELFKIARKIQQLTSTNFIDVDKKYMLSLISDLKDYVIYHFQEEELFMKEIGYPLLDSHKLAHDSFNELISCIDSVDIIQTIKQLEIILKDWIIEHIRSQDYTLKLYLNSSLMNK